MRIFFFSVLIFFLFSAMAETVPEADSRRQKDYERALLLVRTMETLRRNYVDPGKVSYEKLFDHAMNGMLNALDPYSEYDTPAESGDKRIALTGELTGIGVESVKPDLRYLIITRVMPNSPAEKSGLHAGDQICEIDGIPVLKLNMAACVKKLRGPVGTQVKLKVIRKDKAMILTVTRAAVVRPGVHPGCVKMMAGKIGYIKLETFNMHTAEEFAAALKKLRSEGARALIVDLRYNPGGVVDAGIRICSQLLPGNRVLFRTVERTSAKCKEVKSIGKFTIETEIPVVLLVNSFSASCSELLTGALQDNKRAVVVGTRTFGKGTLLNVVKLPNGGMMRYASAYYVTPAGKVIEKRGIQPDVEVKISQNELFRLSSQGYRFPGEIQPEAGSAIRDRQLARAYEEALNAAKQHE